MQTVLGPLAGYGAGQLLIMLAGLAMGALARGYSGFGMSAVLVASWSLAGVPAEAVAVTMVLEVIASVAQAVSVWRQIPWQRVGLLIGGALLGTPLGVHLLAVTGERALRLGIAVFILVAAVALFAGIKLRSRSTPLRVALVGVLSGACNGAVAMGGLPVAIFLTADGVSPQALRASVVAYFFLLDLAGLAFLSGAGLATPHTLGLAAWCLPVMAAGMWLGGRHFLGATPEGFRRITLGLLAALALAGIVRALT